MGKNWSSLEPKGWLADRALLLHMGTSRLYGYSARFGLNPREKRGKKQRKNWIFWVFSRFFRSGSLENHPRRPPASFCTHPELRKPKFDQFRPNFHIFFNLFDPPKYENPTFSFYFFKNRPRNHAQIVDLAESFRLVPEIPQKT